MQPVVRLAIAATFTADGVAAPLTELLARVALPAAVELAPWGQLFQTLLDPGGGFARNVGGINVALLRASDLGSDEIAATAGAQDLVRAMRDAAASTPLVVAVSPSRAPEPWLPRIERILVDALADAPGIVLVAPADVAHAYPLAGDEILDPYRDKLAAVPYTDLYLAALAATLARRIRCLREAPRKVVVLDCDDTLWGGLCGELGAAAVTLDPSRLALQQFIVDQHAAGMLIAICSRNNPEDVERVFATRPEMILRAEHVTAWRVGWAAKADSIAAIADELGLGIDSVVLVDDDAFVCGEVRARCAGVAVVELPPAGTVELGAFMRQVWAFDRLRVTRDDRQRAQYYRDNAARERTRATASSLHEFIARLELVVDIKPVTEGEIARAAQLTQRTNQFTSTGTRRTESEIRAAVADGATCRTVEVADRFGRYGVVGVAITRDTGRTLEVDSIVLSCRVLGRGVEHRVIAALGAEAVARGLDTVAVAFRPTAKNAPFEQFLRALPARACEPDRAVMDAARAAAVSHDPDARAVAVPNASEIPRMTTAVPVADIDYGALAIQLGSARAIVAALGGSGAPTTAGSTVEAEITAIWRKVLDLDEVGIDDDFFGLGGDSLAAINMFAMIFERLGVELPLTGLFATDTTVRFLADLVTQALDGGEITDASTSDVTAERALADAVAALSEPELAVQLADWQPVALPPPTAAAPTADAHELTGDRRALFDRWLAQHQVDRRVGQPLPARHSAIAPATLSQQIAWAFHQRGNLPGIGNQPMVVAIHGPIDHDAMRQAVAAVVERQPALRTVFHDDPDAGRLMQITRADGPALEITPPADLSTARALFTEISRPHDLARESLRAQLVPLAVREHLLFLAPHHIVCDGFSRRVLVSDLAAEYRAQLRSEAGRAPLAFQFSDFAFWQTTLEHRPIGKQQLDGWARAMAGYEDLELPGDRGSPPRGTVGLALDTHAAASVPVRIDGASWQAVERVSTALGCTPYVVVATAFLLLLSRWSGRRDVCLQSGSFHRNRRGSEAIIGDFNTAYPLRVPFDDSSTLEAAVLRCHEAVLAYRANAHVAPTSVLGAWAAWTRYTLNYQVDAEVGATATASDLISAKLERLEWNAVGVRPDDLALILRQGAADARGMLLYNVERFSPELAARAVGRLDEILAAMTGNLGTRLSALPRAP